MDVFSGYQVTVLEFGGSWQARAQNLVNEFAPTITANAIDPFSALSNLINIMSLMKSEVA